MSVLGSLQGFAQAVQSGLGSASERAREGLWAGKRLLDEGGAGAEALVLAKRALGEAVAAEAAARDALEAVVAAYEDAAAQLKAASACGQNPDGLDEECTQRGQHWQQLLSLAAGLGPSLPAPVLTTAEWDASVILRTRDMRSKVKDLLQPLAGSEDGESESPQRRAFRKEVCSSGPEEGPLAPLALGRMLFGSGGACSSVCRSDSRESVSPASAGASPLPAMEAADSPEQLAETLFGLLDTDADGLLSEEEVRELNKHISMLRYRQVAGTDAVTDRCREVFGDHFDAARRPLNCDFFCKRLLLLLEEMQAAAGDEQPAQAREALAAQLKCWVAEAQSSLAAGLLAKAASRRGGTTPRGPLGVPVMQRSRMQAPLSAVSERTLSTDSVLSEVQLPSLVLEAAPGAEEQQKKEDPHTVSHWQPTPSSGYAERAPGINLRSAMWPLDEDRQTFPGQVPKPQGHV
eukprot:TRINITY_DN61217_c0_g1_i1.p1 TRINITY_DN61217_c0_g1~~TRINITY_DN61217_c0_g1_i1.p1  ORF type:complete len:462 (+),score=114.58 TRINITY_DN61217_c0_g1_i1:66-1451(+)